MNMVKLWVVILVVATVVTCFFPSRILQVVAFLTLLTSVVIEYLLAYFDLPKKKIQAEQKRKDPMSAKKGDPFCLLAHSEGNLLTVQRGDTEQPHTKVDHTWYRSVQLDTFVFEDTLYQVVALKPDPYYKALVEGPKLRLQA